MARVLKMYATGFERAFSTFAATKLEDNTIYYQGLGWGAADVPTLVTALQYLATLAAFEAGPIAINLTDNEFDAEDEVRLQEAVEGCAGVQALWL